MNLFAVVFGLLNSLSVAAAPTVLPSPPTPGTWPLISHHVVQGFEPPSHAYGAGHRGVDLLGTLATPVYAARDGTVSFAGPLAGRGVVVIDHGDTRTTYEPVDPTVTAGTSVAAGDQIGRLEVNQSHCFPDACLHWGWINNADDTYRDPLDLVATTQRVRLLPLA